MKPADREDLLLAVQRLFSRNGRSPVQSDLAAATNRNESDIRSDLAGLAEDNEVVLQADGGVSLTPRGEEAAGVVMRKHKVLEAFFEEMLGMDREAAHHEACTLEHITSDETISRLGSFIRSAPPCLTNQYHDASFGNDGHGNRDPDSRASTHVSCDCVMLSECNEGEVAYITAIKGCGRAARLADLGIFPGEELLVRRQMAKTLLVQVKGCDIALSSEVAKTVLVERCR
ncbi:MAG TPA: metal-dependent transcriptional regulator [Methanospirillum sp.]|nr:metal-dependent transcriptional regulator [Methanospirillum sp.]